MLTHSSICRVLLTRGNAAVRLSLWNSCTKHKVLACKLLLFLSALHIRQAQHSTEMKGQLALQHKSVSLSSRCLIQLPSRASCVCAGPSHQSFVNQFLESKAVRGPQMCLIRKGVLAFVLNLQIHLMLVMLFEMLPNTRPLSSHDKAIRFSAKCCVNEY